MNRKKLLALVLALAMLVSLTACSSNTASTATEAPAATATTAANSDPYAQAAAAQNNDPYAQAAAAQNNDPYAQAASAANQANDPYAQAASAANQANDPYAQAAAAANSSNSTETAATEAPTEEPAAATEYVPVPSEGAKYTVETTADGWIKITQDGGETLGLASTSGVTIIEDDGYAFKDMNQNGKLDTYEDWRLTSEERTADLVSQMTGAEIAAMMTHGGWGSFTTEPLATDGSDTSYTYLMAGGRGGVTRAISNGGGAHAKWANAIQTVAESCLYGIPAMISIDPANISGLIETLSLASTMDTELAAKIGETTAKQYRAAGVTALLGPQVDIASPVMSRAGGTYGEDPQLTLDIATAYVNAMQSTYDADGNDLGWGSESVYCFTKHFFGAGSTEGGRDDHANAGRYATFPGNNLEAHAITYLDGVFKLPGKTGSSGIMTEYAIDVDADGNPYGGEAAGCYNTFIYGLLDAYGYDSLKITDWGTYTFAGWWGSELLAEPDRIATSWERGANLLGGYSSTDNAVAAWQLLVDRHGEADAKAMMDKIGSNFIVVMMNLNMFENPYSDSAYADSIIYSDESNAYGLETQKASVVMIKNSNNVIAKQEASAEKKTVYVPLVYSTGFTANWMSGIGEENPSWGTTLDLDALANYFNVITDTANGTEITRASDEDIAKADYILVGMEGAYQASYNAHLTGAFYGNTTEPTTADEWYAPSLQYEDYTASTARAVSVSGKVILGVKENRSYKDSTVSVPMKAHLETLQWAKSIAGDKPVIAAVQMERGMIWNGVEENADVILVSYNSQKTEAIAEIILGQLEPNGLLVFQQPASMEVVEAQNEDVPRDMECYVDTNGNTYDFAFGMNWSGVIDDARTQKYKAEPLTKVQSFDFAAYVEANH